MGAEDIDNKDHVENLRKLHLTLTAISFTLLAVVFWGSSNQLQKAITQLNNIIEVANRGEYRCLEDMIINDCYKYRLSITKDSSWDHMPIKGIKLFSIANKFPSQTYKLPLLPIVFQDSYGNNFNYVLRNYFEEYSTRNLQFKTLSEFILIWDLLSKSDEIIYIDRPKNKKAYLILYQRETDYESNDDFLTKNKLTIIDSFSISYSQSNSYKTKRNLIEGFYEYKNISTNVNDSLLLYPDSAAYKGFSFQQSEALIKLFKWDKNKKPYALVLDTWNCEYSDKIVNGMYQLIVPFDVLYLNYNLQEQFIRDNRHNMTYNWRLGSFKDAFPELYQRTNALMQNKPLSDLYTEFLNESEKSNNDFSLFGVNLASSTVGTLGPIIILLVFIYFLINLYHYVKYIKKLNSKINIAWIALYQELPAKILTLISIIILPSTTIIVIVFNTQNSNIYRVILTVISLTFTLLPYLLLRKLWNKDKN